MNEFIKKLIERLEEKKISVKSFSDVVHNNAVKICISEVNQLAEEYNNESIKGDLISRDALLEEIKSLRVTVMGLRAGKGILAEYAKQYKDTLLRVIEEQPTAYNDGWIPVSSGKLPEEHDSIFAKLKGTDKWNNAMFEKTSDEVNVTVEFEDGTRKTMALHTIDGKWNTRDKIVKFKVIAWQPLPAPYQPKGE